MKVAIRKLGNSRGVIIPKPLLKQVGLERQAELLVEDRSLVLRRPRDRVRQGWAAACRELAESGEATAWPEFGNEGDAGLKW